MKYHDQDWSTCLSQRAKRSFGYDGSTAISVIPKSPALYDTLIVAIYPYITRLDKVLKVLMLQIVLNNYIKFPIILSNSVHVYFNISILHNDIFTITCTIETQFLMIWHHRKSWWNFIRTRHDKWYIYVTLSMLHLYIFKKFRANEILPPAYVISWHIYISNVLRPHTVLGLTPYQFRS